MFGPAEYFALYLLAFCTLGGIASNNQAKAAIAACLGLGIAMIGLDNTTGMPRFTGGNLHLMDGVDFLVAIVGLFAVSEVFLFIESHGKNTAIGVKLEKITIPVKDIVGSTWTMLRSTLIGFFAGVLPGAGASLGSFLGLYGRESRLQGQRHLRHRQPARRGGTGSRQQCRRRRRARPDADTGCARLRHHGGTSRTA